MTDNTIANRILRALPPDELGRLKPHLTPVELHRGQVIARPDKSVTENYFINRGVVSLIKTMSDGESVEIGARGIEGLTAPETVLGMDMPLFEAVVQIPGAAFMAEKALLREIFAEPGRFRSVTTKYIHAAASQVAQTAACNRLHFLEQRCARWLLFAHDNVQADTFSITHEFLAMMLGVHRPGVSVAIQNFQSAGIVSYVRGQITIRNRRELEQASCECYRTIADEFDRVFRPNGRNPD